MRPTYTMHDNTTSNNVLILLARLSAAGKEVVLYLVARNTLYKKKYSKVISIFQQRPILFIQLLLNVKSLSMYILMSLWTNNSSVIASVRGTFYNILPELFVKTLHAADFKWRIIGVSLPTENSLYRHTSISNIVFSVLKMQNNIIFFFGARGNLFYSSFCKRTVSLYFICPEGILDETLHCNPILQSIFAKLFGPCTG
jgi:hypothetical protein